MAERRAIQLPGLHDARWQVEAAIHTTEQVISLGGYEGKIGIAFDEWNLRGWHHPDGNSPAAIAARDRNDINATYSMADAVFSAGFLNTCLRHADTVKMANMAPVINTRGPLFVHPGGIVRRPTFHVFWMYANLLAERIADTFVVSDSLHHNGQAAAAFDGIATSSATQSSWRLALINRDPEQTLSCKVVLTGQPLEGRFPATILCGDSPDAYNDIDRPERVAPEKRWMNFDQGMTVLPPHSITILEVDR